MLKTTISFTLVTKKAGTIIMDIEIREVKREDLPSIHAIYHDSVLTGTASWEVVPPDADEMQRRMEAILSQGFPYFVAVVGEQVAGYSYASSYRPRPGYRFTVENTIYVDNAYRRQGIAYKLLAHLIEACTERGFRQMVAVIGDSENQPSIDLHQKLGFEHVGVLPAIGFKFGRWLDSVLMQRALGDGHTTLGDS